MSTHEIERVERVEATAIVRQPDELSIEALVGQVQKIQAAMSAVMEDGVHYGVVPGTEKKDKDGRDISKPSLYKPGAEKLCLLFRLDPQYQVDRTFSPDGHLDVLVTCTLYHINSGQRIASGVGSCSTRESRYAYRNASRVCPTCGKDAIIKGKDEYGGGWVCFKKKDGCGAKFKDGDASIEGQVVGRVANPDLADLHNTAVKMGCKRALVAAVLNGTAASDCFTQDVEDMPQFGGAVEPAGAAPAPAATPVPAKVDDVTLARSQALHQLFVKKFGRQPREVALGTVARDIGQNVTSYNDLSKSDAKLLFEKWGLIEDGKGVPFTMPGGSAANPTTVPRVEVPADAGSGAAGDNGLPFGDVDVSSPPKLLGDRIAEAAWRARGAHGIDPNGQVQIDLALATALKIRGGWWSPFDLVSKGVGDDVLTYFEQIGGAS